MTFLKSQEFEQLVIAWFPELREYRRGGGDPKLRNHTIADFQKFLLTA